MLKQIKKSRQEGETIMGFQSSSQILAAMSSTKNNWHLNYVVQDAAISFRQWITKYKVSGLLHMTMQ
jgi:hypothetical protein